jgi:hypothetical protein
MTSVLFDESLEFLLARHKIIALICALESLGSSILLVGAELTLWLIAA